MTAMENELGVESRLRPLALLADRASVLVQALAQPWVVQLVMRVALAIPFWKSGMLKWDGFLQLNDTAVTLFTDELKLHLPGGPYPFPAPTVMAFLSGSAEIIFPILLVLGFGTRFAATGLLFMTLIVELTVPDGWPIHITWAAMELGIMAWGPGALSADYLIRHFLNLPTKRGGRGSHTVWTLRSVAKRPAARTGGGSLVDSPKSPF